MYYQFCKYIQIDFARTVLTLYRYAYVFACRYLNGEILEDTVESAGILLNIVPLLADTQRTAFPNVSEAISYVYQQLAEVC